MPIAEALDLREASEAVRAAVAIIGMVHGDGSLQIIPVRLVADVAFAAAYARSPDDGRPLAILVNRFSAVQAWAMVHEVGHFLDHQALDESGRYASHSSGLLDDWRQAVDASQAVRRLQRILTDGAILVFDEGIERWVPVDARFLERQISYPEIWARSYAQYVAVRSGHQWLLSHLADLLGSDDPAGGPPYTLQWEATDFVPILVEIDRLFKAKGWRE